MQSVITKSSIAWNYQTEAVLRVCVLVLAIIPLSTSGKHAKLHVLNTIYHVNMIDYLLFPYPCSTISIPDLQCRGTRKTCMPASIDTVT